MDFSIVVLLVIITAATFWLFGLRRARQLKFIDNFVFHSSIKNKLVAKYPHLNEEQIALIFEGLRSYFRICNSANRRMVAMPSQAVDMAWHEFIIFTKAYQDFCNKALGRYLHHTPTEAMVTPTHAEIGIKRAWRLSCIREQINPKSPERLPLLFAIDGLLNIENGYKYSLNCKNRLDNGSSGGGGYCAGDIGCSSGGGGGCGGGCSGDSGCGGGCGGGD
ncbi:glycine-rich domain-containing protein [Sulfuriferula nivalis]|uniref:glycine-rich domain-containing protein n=1 Tax=Sulfuriferula nivalis TaxID=2675298 RepID=UPI0013899F5F|nr:hypothetical protein [Sulfuriferula nivalis]